MNSFCPRCEGFNDNLRKAWLNEFQESLLISWATKKVTILYTGRWKINTLSSCENNAGYTTWTIKLTILKWPKDSI